MHKSKTGRTSAEYSGLTLGWMSSVPVQQTEKCLHDNDAERATPTTLFEAPDSVAGRKWKLPNKKTAGRRQPPGGLLVCRPLLPQNVELVFRH